MIDWSNNPPLGLYTADEFHVQLQKFTTDILGAYGLKASLSTQRIHTAFECWKSELERSGQFNFTSPTTPDHVKSAAFLAYWTRRFSPIVNLETTPEFVQEIQKLGIQVKSAIGSTGQNTPLKLDDPRILPRIHLKTFQGNSLSSVISERQNLLHFGNEFIAFAFTYFAMKHIHLKVNPSLKWTPPSKKMIHEICVMFKFKSVSPHSLYLIYLSIIESWR